MCRPIKLLLCTEVNSYRRPFQASTNLEESMGFEPMERFHVRLISNQVP